MKTSSQSDRFLKIKNTYRLLGTSEYALEVLEHVKNSASTYMEIERYVRDLRKIKGIINPMSPRIVANLIRSFLNSGLCTRDKQERYRVTPSALELLTYAGPAPLSYYWTVGRIVNIEQIPETEREDFIDNVVSILQINGWRIVDPIDSIVRANHKMRVLGLEGFYDQGITLLWPDGRILCGLVVPDSIEIHLRNAVRNQYKYTEPNKFKSNFTLEDDVSFVRNFMIYRLRLVEFTIDFLFIADPANRFRSTKDSYIKWEESFHFWHRFYPPLRYSKTKRKAIKETDLSNTIPDFLWIKRVSNVNEHIRASDKIRPEQLEDMKRVFSPDIIEMEYKVEKLERELGLGRSLPGTIKHSVAILLNNKVFAKKSIQSSIDILEQAITSKIFNKNQVKKIRKIESSAKKRWEEYWNKPYPITKQNKKD